jgi:hypothetical protein
MTLLEEDKAALQWMFINHTAEERVALIEAIAQLWCLKCGRQYTDGPFLFQGHRGCPCENDE